MCKKTEKEKKKIGKEMDETSILLEKTLYIIFLCLPQKMIEKAREREKSLKKGEQARKKGKGQRKRKKIKKE